MSVVIPSGTDEYTSVVLHTQSSPKPQLLERVNNNESLEQTSGESTNVGSRKSSGTPRKSSTTHVHRSNSDRDSISSNVRPVIQYSLVSSRSAPAVTKSPPTSGEFLNVTMPQTVDDDDLDAQSDTSVISSPRPTVSRPASIQIAIEQRLSSLARAPIKRQRALLSRSTSARIRRNKTSCVHTFCSKSQRTLDKALRCVTAPIRAIWDQMSYRERVVVLLLVHNLNLVIDVLFSYVLYDSGHDVLMYISLAVLFWTVLPWIAMILPCIFYPLTWVALRIVSGGVWCARQLIRIVTCGWYNMDWSVDTFPGTYDIGALCATYPALSLVCGVPSFYLCEDGGLCECFPGLEGIEQVYHQRYYTVFRRALFQDIPQIVLVIAFLVVHTGLSLCSTYEWIAFVSLLTKSINLLYIYVSRMALRHDFVIAQQLTDEKREKWQFDENICSLFVCCGLTRVWNHGRDRSIQV